MNSRAYFYVSSAILALLIVFFLGIYAASNNTLAYRLLLGFFKEFQDTANTVQSAAGDPINFLQPARLDGIGVTVNKAGDDEKLILMAGFFDGGNQIRLIQRDGEILRKWPVAYYALFDDVSHIGNPPATNLNIDTHGALALPDGSIIFNFEGGGTVKLSKCGALVWQVKFAMHHSVELAADGGFWIPGLQYHNSQQLSRDAPLPPFTRLDRYNFSEDLILHVTPDGKIDRRISLIEVLLRNGLEPQLGLGKWLRYTRHFTEITHLNKVGELGPDMADAFPMFETGDLLISTRDINLIAVLDPDTLRIKWHQIGPWIRQHDPEFLRSGKIGLFNNNSYDETSFETDLRVRADIPIVSNLMEVDPATGQTQIVFGSRADQGFNSTIRGKIDPTDEGGYLVTEFEGGRVFEADEAGQIVWEFINRYDDDEVAEITEARLYPADYFEVEDWSCPDD